MATLTMIEQVSTPKPVSNRGLSNLQELTTETANAASEGLDTKSAIEIARIISHEDAKVAAAVKKALPEIALVIDTRNYTEFRGLPAILGLTVPRTLSINLLNSFIEEESVPAVAAFFTALHASCPVPSLYG